MTALASLQRKCVQPNEHDPVRRTVRSRTEEASSVAGGGCQLRVATLDDTEFHADVALQAMRAPREPPDDFDEVQWRAGLISWTEEQVRGDVPFNTTSVVVAGGEAIRRARRPQRPLHRARGNPAAPPGRGTPHRDRHRPSAASIVRRLQAEAVESGVPLERSVERDNPRARALYLRLGFERVDAGGGDGGGDGDGEEGFRRSPVSATRPLHAGIERPSIRSQLQHAPPTARGACAAPGYRLLRPSGASASCLGPVVQSGVHAALSRRRARVQIPSGPLGGSPSNAVG
jgi:hypothetical protein